MTITLRDYQQEAVDKTIEYLFTRDGNPLVVAPTGSGKSLMIAALCARLSENGAKKIIVLAHRKELLVQNESAIKKLNPNITTNFYSAALRNKSLQGDIIIAGIASIAKVDAGKFPKFDYIIIDEAHLVNNEDDGIYRKFISYFPAARKIGFSATPFRLNGGLLHRHRFSIFTDIVVEIPIIKLMQQGYLSYLVSKISIEQPNLEKLHVRAGEFIQAEYDNIYTNKDLIRKTIDDIIQYAEDRSSWLIFCSSVNHVQKVHQELKKRGISSDTITGKTPAKMRDDIIDNFKSRKIKALVNCDVLTVGFDAPNVDLIAILRPTKSCGLFIQICGRGTRLFSNKANCLILDYGGNLERFGPIDEISLVEDKFGKVQAERKYYKACERCRACISLKAKQCGYCGYSYTSEQIERAINHSTIASDLMVISDNFVQENFNGKTMLTVIDWKMELFEKPDKPTAIKVDYYVTERDMVTEYICIEHKGQAYDRAAAWWRKHSDTGIPANCNEFLANQDRLKLPKEIAIDMYGSYPVIVGCKYE